MNRIGFARGQEAFVPPMSDPARTMSMDGTRVFDDARVESHLDATLPRQTARAPARLDVMGGITDCTGGLSLALNLCLTGIFILGVIRLLNPECPTVWRRGPRNTRSG